MIGICSISIIIITEESAHVDIFFLFFFLLNGSSSLGSTSGGSWASTCSRGVLGGVKHGLGLRELKARHGRDSDEVLETIQKGVRSGSLIGDT